MKARRGGGGEHHVQTEFYRVEESAWKSYKEASKKKREHKRNKFSVQVSEDVRRDGELQISSISDIQNLQGKNYVQRSI